MSERFTVRVEGGCAFACGKEEGVLLAMERAGHRDLIVGCRRGGCGHCKVQVLRGGYRLGKMSRLQVSHEEETKGYALACRLFPESELEVRPCPPPGARRT